MAVQVTSVFEAFMTVAVNCRVPPGCKLAAVGERVTLTTGAALIVTWAVADFVGSATDVALTVKDPAPGPAVYRPAVVMVPPVADHVTAVLDDPVTVAVNVRCWPG